MKDWINILINIYWHRLTRLTYIDIYIDIILSIPISIINSMYIDYTCESTLYFSWLHNVQTLYIFGYAEVVTGYLKLLSDGSFVDFFLNVVQHVPSIIIIDTWHSMSSLKKIKIILIIIKKLKRKKLQPKTRTNT